MPGLEFLSNRFSFSDNKLNGGLNSTAGPLGLNNNEASDLQNIDFDKFGSISKRNGYTALNTSAISGSPQGDGLYWYEYDDSGTTKQTAILIANGKVLKMDDLDGTWDDITGSLTVTAGHHCNFATFLNECYVTNNNDAPFYIDSSLTASTMSVPTGLTKAKFVEEFNNYLFLANVTVSGTAHKSRIYWCNLKDTSTWTATDFIEVSKNDGQEITGLKVLQDRLVIYKTRSIYNLFFTGDADIPFILPGGGKSNSPVGCIAPWSIQEVENGHVFLSTDGIYYYDGINAYKLSDKITYTLLEEMNRNKFSNTVSMVQKDKNRYYLGITRSGQIENNRVIVWDYYNNAFSIYTGISASAMAIFYVNGVEERPYFADYDGFVYRMDTGSDDYPLNVKTAIDAYYWTNWRYYDDLADQKGIVHAYIYYAANNATLTFAYSYDFEDTAQYSTTFSMSQGEAVYGSAIYGTDVYAGAGGGVKRRDLIGRGYVVRFKFANNISGETFRIDGFGTKVHLETAR